MARHSKILTDAQLLRFEEFVLSRHNPIRDTVIINLSFRAGLRVGEMALLRWVDVMDAEGEIAHDVVQIPSQITKFKRRNRTVPMHPKLRESLVKLRALRPTDIYVCNKIYNDDVVDEPIRVNTLTVYIHRMYSLAGFENGSSHSGRGTFITKLTRRANVHHCSIKDVQLMVGHARLETTERYMGPSDDVSKLVFAEL
jgi:integrase/recombinase XerD